MNISYKDGSIRFSDDVVIHAGMSGKILRAFPGAAFDAFVPGSHDIVVFRPDANKRNSLRMEVVLYNDRVSRVNLEVPWKSSIPESREKQFEYLLNAIGKDFFDSAVSSGRDGLFPWGKVSVTWDRNSCRMFLSVAYSSGGEP